MHGRVFLNIPKKRMEGNKPLIACRSTCPTRNFQPVQKIGNQSLIDVLELKPISFDCTLFFTESEKEFKRHSVRCNGVLARIFLDREIRLKEARNIIGEVRARHSAVPLSE